RGKPYGDKGKKGVESSGGRKNVVEIALSVVKWDISLMSSQRRKTSVSNVGS
ncbi:hypothetical protein A2U01_0108119, partial [Trifolium medium]|nr:hypothetical protein [Trifolium medium]